MENQLVSPQATPYNRDQREDTACVYLTFQASQRHSCISLYLPWQVKGTIEEGGKLVTKEQPPMRLTDRFQKLLCTPISEETSHTSVNSQRTGVSTEE